MKRWGLGLASSDKGPRGRVSVPSPQPPAGPRVGLRLPRYGRWAIPVPIWVGKLETALERRRSELDRDEGRLCAHRKHSVQTGRLVTNRLDLAFRLQYWAMVLQRVLWGGGFGVCRGVSKQVSVQALDF